MILVLAAGGFAAFGGYTLYNTLRQHKIYSALVQYLTHAASFRPVVPALAGQVLGHPLGVPLAVNMRFPL
jgi:hypothetical protein